MQRWVGATRGEGKSSRGGIGLYGVHLSPHYNLRRHRHHHHHHHSFAERSASEDRFLGGAVSAGFNSGFEKRRRTIIRDDHSADRPAGRLVGRSADRLPGITRPKVFPSVERRRRVAARRHTRTGGALTGCDKQGVVVLYSSTLHRCFPPGPYPPLRALSYCE